MKIDLEELTAARHQAPEWMTFRELVTHDNRRIDLATFNTWPSKGGLRRAFEMKRSRSDFLRELDDPEKRKFAETYFHESWFVVTQGVCDPAEVPEGWGLLVTTKNGDKLRRHRVARQRTDPKPIPHQVWMWAMRRVMAAHEADKWVRFDGDTVTREHVDEWFEHALVWERKRLAEAEGRAEASWRQYQDAAGRYSVPFQVLQGYVPDDGPEDPTDYYSASAWVEAILAQAVRNRVQRYARDLRRGMQDLTALLAKLEDDDEPV